MLSQNAYKNDDNFQTLLRGFCEVSMTEAKHDCFITPQPNSYIVPSDSRYLP